MPSTAHDTPLRPDWGTDLTSADLASLKRRWITLSFGQHKNGRTLFPKRTAPNGDLLAERGCKRFGRYREQATPGSQKSE
jgi:hypothetical protein